MRKREVKWLVFPLYPQSFEATTLLIMENFFQELKRRSTAPNFEFISSFYHYKSFINACVRKIAQTLETLERADTLVLSFHGIPNVKLQQNSGQLYYDQCLETFELIKEKLQNDNNTKGLQIELSFQSRFLNGKWLEPYTEDMVISLIKKGRNIAIFSPSFVISNFETDYELGIELKERVDSIGGKLSLISCIDDDYFWSKEFVTELIERDRPFV